MGGAAVHIETGIYIQFFKQPVKRLLWGCWGGGPYVMFIFSITILN